MVYQSGKRRAEAWRQRLNIPFYKIGEAARYARTSAVTAARWHKEGGGKVLSTRDGGEELSYLQLIELGVVAAMRKEGVKLSVIKAAREYIANSLGKRFPFAEYRFKTDGKHLIISYDQVEPSSGIGKLLYASNKGQLGWNEILGNRLKEFEYDDEGIASRWRVRGPASSIVIDPRIAFGAPSVAGAATWTVKSRWVAGEGLEDIAEDLGLTSKHVTEALEFEGIRPDFGRQNLWAS